VGPVAIPWPAKLTPTLNDPVQRVLPDRNRFFGTAQETLHQKRNVLAAFPERSQAAQLYTPRTVTQPKQPVMTPDDVMRALSVLDLCERLFCRLAIFAGTRPIRWCLFPKISRRR
jgi:hypothetical protein